MEQYNPPHPGEILQEVYIKPFNLVPNKIAKEQLKVSPSTLNRILNMKSDVTPEMALRLSIVFGGSPESWLAMQDNYSLWKARKTMETKDLVPISFETLLQH